MKYLNLRITNSREESFPSCVSIQQTCLYASVPRPQCYRGGPAFSIRRGIFRFPRKHFSKSKDSCLYAFSSNYGAVVRLCSFQQSLLWDTQKFSCGHVRSSIQLTSTCTRAALNDEESFDTETHVDTIEYCVVNFYHLVDIPNPHEEVQKHKEFLENKNVRGRIYISSQGINAQYGGEKSHALEYAGWLAESQPLFKGLKFSVFPAEEHMFPKLRLQYKPNLISLAGGMRSVPVTDPLARATPLAPNEWKNMISNENSENKPLVLDLRNGYEWDAGHFEGAERPQEEEFNQTPTEGTPSQVPIPLQDVNPETPVMMYCTGGIRCDVYSAYLKKKGYKNLYTLEGGIQNYLRTEGIQHWNGSLFVFDGRMAIRPNKDEDAPLEAAAPCQICGGKASLPHINCANIDCNKLFIACDDCKTLRHGCCCEECMDAPRLLRPMKTKGQYGNWTQYTDPNDLEVTESMASGRGSGRISRRRKRQQALKEKNVAKRTLKVERRRFAKEVQQKYEAFKESGEEKRIDDSKDKLKDLRERRKALLNERKATLNS